MTRLTSQKTELNTALLCRSRSWLRRLCFGVAASLFIVAQLGTAAAQDELTPGELDRVLAAQQARVDVIQKVYGSVVAVYGDDQNGGGSGVIFDPSGLALTNHHVIMGAGVSGLGGLADGKLYPWKLIGTDPGGDVAIIKLEGEEPFPYSILADSDTVRVGDWSLAMGNPFILAEDQTPTVTLGIVSGVKRYQYGQGNELVYGNCIQTDSSINPGNSGGPLFNMHGQVIGINGRGSFEERGRVNVGLGYAISSNQIRNFIPELMATKLVEHGTLDARFGNRTDGVICESINRDAPIAKLGLDLGDRLLTFEGEAITDANQFTNLICTLPEDWPAEISFQKPGGEVKHVHVRLLGLPYTPPPPPREPPKKENEEGEEQEPTPAQKKAMEKQRAMVEMLSSTPGTIRDKELNRANLFRLVDRWRSNVWNATDQSAAAWRIEDELVQDGRVIGTQSILLDQQGRFRLTVQSDSEERVYVFDGKTLAKKNGDSLEPMRSTDAAADPYVAQILPIASLRSETPLSLLGEMQLDGGGKAQHQPAYRLKSIDERGNWFYCWLSIPEGMDKTELRLLKASVDMDSGEGAVTFGQWTQHDGLNWPQQRTFVRGLAELPRMSIVTRQMVAMESPASEMFQISSTESGEQNSVVVPTTLETSNPGESEVDQ